MFVYCTERLNLSESEAYLRIAVARAARKHPAILPMLQAGRLYLSGIAKLAPVLTEANCNELLERATRKTKKKIEALVAEVAPKPDVPSTMRKLPARREPPKAAPVAATCPKAVDEVPASSSPPTAPLKCAVVEPLAPSRYKIQFTAGAELHEKLERLLALMLGSDLAAVVDVAVTEKLERVLDTRCGVLADSSQLRLGAETSVRRSCARIAISTRTPTGRSLFPRTATHSRAGRLRGVGEHFHNGLSHRRPFTSEFHKSIVGLRRSWTPSRCERTVALTSCSLPRMKVSNIWSIAMSDCSTESGRQ